MKTIKENLTHTRLEDRATVRLGDAFSYLESTSEQFDVIYIAPPQYQGIWVGALTAVALRHAKLLAADGLIVVQIAPKEYQEINHPNIVLDRQKSYGTTMLCFYTAVDS